MPMEKGEAIRPNPSFKQRVNPRKDDFVSGRSNICSASSKWCSHHGRGSSPAATSVVPLTLVPPNASFCCRRRRRRRCRCYDGSSWVMTTLQSNRRHPAVALLHSQMQPLTAKLWLQRHRRSQQVVLSTAASTSAKRRSRTKEDERENLSRT